ncbi:MAG: hypothetical protein LBT53_08980 [Puniceicoccales bacterium]|jgi:hypothetical protein|nr:hypothetical protein [Puniceicoccales bacterium]
MKKTTLAAAILTAAFAVAPVARAQDAGTDAATPDASADGQDAAKPDAKPKPKPVAKPAEKPVPALWLQLTAKWVPCHDPFPLVPTPKQASAWYTVNRQLRTVRGPVLIGRTWQWEENKFADIKRMFFTKEPPIFDAARIAIRRGEPEKALTLVAPVLDFFVAVGKQVPVIVEDRESQPVSLWLRAADIKLDALILQENDLLITAFLRELKASNPESIPGLADRIRLAELSQKFRRYLKIERDIERDKNGRITKEHIKSRNVLDKDQLKEVIKETNDFIKDATDTATLAQLHVLKGNAELALHEFKEALNTFFRVSVFYGNQVKYVPIAKLGAAEAFLGMDKPTKEIQALGLKEVAKRYLRELISTYESDTKEVREATALLDKFRTKEERAAEAKQKAAAADAIITSGNEGGAAAETPAPAGDAPAPAGETPAETPAAEGV